MYLIVFDWLTAILLKEVCLIRHLFFMHLVCTEYWDFLKIFQYNRLFSLISSIFGVCHISTIMCVANRLCSDGRESDVTSQEDLLWFLVSCSGSAFDLRSFSLGSPGCRRLCLIGCPIRVVVFYWLIRLKLIYSLVENTLNCRSRMTPWFFKNFDWGD